DEVGVLKEKAEYNDEKKSITLNGVEGDVFKYFKSFKPVYQFTQKEGSIATSSIAYEKLNDNVAGPDKYVGLMVNIVKDLDAHFIKAEEKHATVKRATYCLLVHR
ncbi:PREDICTED: MLP, partial [Prunus dulcis]